MIKSTTQKKNMAFISAALFLVIAIAALIFLSPRGGKPSNVLFIVIDALRADHLNSFGYSRSTSPFLYTLSQESTSFENVISQSSWTKTAMPSILTSLSPETHGVRSVRDVLSDTVVLLPEVLKKHGYRTCCVHGNPWMEERFGFNQGYDKFLYIERPGYSDAKQVNREALNWIDEVKSQPFFLYLHYMDVHDPYSPPERFDIFGKKKIDKYDGEILYLDARIKQLLMNMKNRGLLKNTWVIITADHGEEFQDHGGRRHGKTLYAEVLKVPLIFHHAGIIKRGKRVKRQVKHLDLIPTILDLIGIDIPIQMEGISLKKEVVGSPLFRRKDLEAYSQVGLNDGLPHNDLISVTTPRFKYIFDFESKAEQLFDLKEDPREQHEISIANPDLVAMFRRKINRFMVHQAAKKSVNIEKTEIDDTLKERLRALGYLN